MHLPRSRSLFFLAFIVCALIIGATLYLEHGVGLAPCPLCTLQRALVTAFGVICLVAVLHVPGKTGWRIYALLMLLCALVGAVSAGRQVLLQTAPVQDPSACSTLASLLGTTSFPQAISQMFDRTADCVHINWTLFGMSVPEWSLLAFAGMILFAAYQLLRRDSTGAGDVKPARNAGED